jgi:23S rRNA (adenine2503-C2)-methyltransferase
MNLKNLEKILQDEPKFRLKQAKQAVFIDLIENWSEATNFSLPLREKLNQECALAIQGKIFKSRDSDSLKALISLDDGLKIETVLLSHIDGRQTVCVSSQVGCPLGCLFCATGKMGFKRNLTADEIVEQVIFFARLLKKRGARVSG